jgi:murein DD-endopeptidase MepM/ murein hydrolase activator NlpD
VTGAALALLLFLGQDRRQVLGELEAFDLQIDTLAQEAESLDRRIEALEASRSDDVGTVATFEQRLAERRAATTRRVQAIYRLKRRGLARLLFDAESPSDLRRRVQYLLAVLEDDRAGLSEYLATLAARRDAAARATSDLAALTGLREELRTRQEALQAERVRRRALIKEVQTRPETAALVVQERSAAAAALSRSLEPEPAAPPEPPSDAAGFRALKGRLPRPVSGRVIRGFGPYDDPISGRPATNLGVDFEAPLGTPFRAVADGVVSRSAWVRGYGQVVMLEHGPYVSLYAHANGLRVAQGQEVRQGDVLGHVGNTGLAETEDARLHFELRYNNTPQDPTEWLGR